MINQVNSVPELPYMFISCSDDETIKVWGVQSKVRVEIMAPINIRKKDGVKKFDIKNEDKKEEEVKVGEERDRSERRSRSSRSRPNAYMMRSSRSRIMPRA